MGGLLTLPGAQRAVEIRAWQPLRSQLDPGRLDATASLGLALLDGGHVRPYGQQGLSASSTDGVP